MASAHSQIPALKSELDQSSPSLPETNGIQALDLRLAEARALLADPGLTNVPAGVVAEDLWTRRALLRRLVHLYEQQASSLAELRSTKTRAAELSREAQTWTSFAEPRPYSIHLADGLRQELQAERLNLSSGEQALVSLDTLLEDNHNFLKQAEEKLRQFNERLEGAKDPVVAARLSWERELERLRSQVAAATVGVLEGERLLQKENLGASRVRVGLLQRQLVIAEAGARFSQADLDQVTTNLDVERGKIEGELAEAQTQRDNALKALEAAREELRSATISVTRVSSSNSLPRATELVSLREAQLDAADTALRVLRLSLEGNNVERTMWQLRFAAYGSRSVDTLSDSQRRLGAFTRRLDLWRQYQRQQLEVSSSQIQLQETRLNNLPSDSDLRSLATDRLAALRQRDQFHLRFERNIERLERLIHRWTESIHAAESKLPVSGRVRNLFSDAGLFLQRLWNFELFTAEDTITVDGQKITGKRSVTIGKIIMAVLILVVGVWLTGLISRLVEPVFVRRLKIEPNQASLIRRWLRAFMVVCLILFSLTSVKIPLTLFAFAGGALAIGLGFGMQTLLKNFVSGLIILFERPFRVGDVLDVGGQRGTVTGVGLRASVLQLWDGTETLIPNSTLLENNLTNWTYSNRKVRFTVSVGVAYGSDPRRIMQILNDVAERHGLVEKEPKPQVFFSSFGDSALDFELRFWVDVTVANAAQVSSDLRMMIAGSLAENAIEIVFPQRDVHLHAAGPIPVQVVPAPSVRAETGPISNGQENNDEARNKPIE